MEGHHFLWHGGKEGAKSCCLHKLICRIRGGKSKESSWLTFSQRLQFSALYKMKRGFIYNELLAVH